MAMAGPGVGATSAAQVWAQGPAPPQAQLSSGGPAPGGRALAPRVSRGSRASVRPPPCGKPLPPVLCFPWLDTSLGSLLLGSVLTRLLQSEPRSPRHSSGCESCVLGFVPRLPHELHSEIRGLIRSSQCLKQLE